MSTAPRLPTQPTDENTNTSVGRRIEGVLRELVAGDMIIVLDDKDRENEGNLVMVAEHICGFFGGASI